MVTVVQRAKWVAWTSSKIANEVSSIAPVRQDSVVNGTALDQLDDPMMPLRCRSSKIAATELEAFAPSPTNRSPPALT